MIDEYLLDELSEEEKEAFELHFLGCDACFQELKLLKNLIHSIRKEGKIIS